MALHIHPCTDCLHTLAMVLIFKNITLIIPYTTRYRNVATFQGTMMLFACKAIMSDIQNDFGKTIVQYLIEQTVTNAPTIIQTEFMNPDLACKNNWKLPCKLRIFEN
eukprot:Gb_29744 [translate_table: standard]